MAPGCICFVPSGAKNSGVISASDALVVNTNLKYDASHSEDSVCNRAQLNGVNVLLVSIWENRPLRIQF